MAPSPAPRLLRLLPVLLLVRPEWYNSSYKYGLGLGDLDPFRFPPPKLLAPALVEASKYRHSSLRVLLVESGGGEYSTLDSDVYCGVVLQVELVLGSGRVEVEVLRFANPDGLNADGLCCSGLADPVTLKCEEPCGPPVYRICLKEWQRDIDPHPPCTYGSRVTADISAPLSFPFSYAWPVSLMNLEPLSTPPWGKLGLCNRCVA